MSPSRSPSQLAKIGLVGLAAIVLVVVASLNIQRLPIIGQGTTFRADFSDASGLVKGEAVRVAGIKVGTVTDVALKGDKVRVSFTVKGVPLGRSSSAGIALQTLLGQHYLDLTPSGGGDLAPGSVIPLSRTSTPINIVPAFDRLTTETDQVDTDQLAQAFDVLAKTLSDTAPQVAPTLKGLARLSETINTRDDAINELFKRASTVSGTVAARDNQLGDLLTDTSNVLTVLDQRRAVITQVIDGTSALSRQITGLVSDEDPQIGNTLTKLDNVLKLLETDRDEIDEVIKGANLYAREFTNVGGSGRWFDSVIKLPSDYSLCRTDNAPPTLSRLLDPLLSALNQSVNHSSQPCLPLGPATGAP